MLIIFGTRRMRKGLGVVLVMCQRCQRPCAHQVLRLQMWFTLFFIPVIPLSSKYYTVCSLCSGATKIDKEQALRMQQAAQEQAAQPPQMTPDGPITPYATVPASAPLPASAPDGAPAPGPMQSYAPPAAPPENYPPPASPPPPPGAGEASTWWPPSS